MTNLRMIQEKQIITQYCLCPDSQKSVYVPQYTDGTQFIVGFLEIFVNKLH